MKYKFLLIAILASLAGCEKGSTGSGDDSIFPTPDPIPPTPTPTPDPDPVPPTPTPEPTPDPTPDPDPVPPTPTPTPDPDPIPPTPTPDPDPIPPTPTPEPDDGTIGTIHKEGMLFPSSETRLMFTPNLNNFDKDKTTFEYTWTVDSNRSGDFGDKVNSVSDRVVDGRSLVLDSGEEGLSVQARVRAIDTESNLVKGEVSEVYKSKARLLSATAYPDQPQADKTGTLVGKYDRKLYSNHVSIGLLSNGEVYALSDDFYSSDFKRSEKIGTVKLQELGSKFLGDDAQRFLTTGDKLYAIGGVLSGKNLTEVASSDKTDPIADVQFYSNGATKLLLVKLASGEVKIYKAGANDALSEVNISSLITGSIQKAFILRAPDAPMDYSDRTDKTDRGSQVAVITDDGSMKVLDFYENGVEFKSAPTVSNVAANVSDAVTFDSGLFVLTKDGQLSQTIEGGKGYDYYMMPVLNDIKNIAATKDVILALSTDHTLRYSKSTMQVNENGYLLPPSPRTLSEMPWRSLDDEVDQILPNGVEDFLFLTTDGSLVYLDDNGVLYDYTYNGIYDDMDDLGAYESTVKTKYGSIFKFSKAYVNGANKRMQTPTLMEGDNADVLEKVNAGGTGAWTDYSFKNSDNGIFIFERKGDTTSDALETKTLKVASIGGLYGSDNVYHWMKSSAAGAGITSSLACGASDDAICDITSTKNALFVTNSTGDLKMVPLAFNANGAGLGLLTKKFGLFEDEDVALGANRMISSPNYDDFSILSLDANSVYHDSFKEDLQGISDKTIVNIQTYKGDVVTATQKYGFGSVDPVGQTYNANDSMSDAMPVLITSFVDPDGSPVQLSQFNKPFDGGKAGGSIFVGGFDKYSEFKSDQVTAFGVKNAYGQYISDYDDGKASVPVFNEGRIENSIYPDRALGFGSFEDFHLIGNFMPEYRSRVSDELGAFSYIAQPRDKESNGLWANFDSSMPIDSYRDQNADYFEKLAYEKVWVGSPYYFDSLKEDKSIVSAEAVVVVNNTPNANGVGAKSNSLVVIYGASPWDGSPAVKPKAYTFKMSNDVLADLNNEGGIFTLIDQDAYTHSGAAYDGVRAIVSHGTGTEIHYISRDGSTDVKPTVDSIDNFIKDTASCDATSGKCNVIESMTMDRVYKNPKRYAKDGEITDANREHLTMVTIGYKAIDGSMNTTRQCFTPDSAAKVACYDRYMLTPELQGVPFISMSHEAYPRKLGSYGDDAAVGKNTAESSTLFKIDDRYVAVNGNYVDASGSETIGISDADINEQLKGRDVKAINYFSDGWLVRVDHPDAEGDYTDIIATNGTKLASSDETSEYDLSGIVSSGK